MSQQSCSACNDLREYAPEFVVNGVTDGVGEHLKQDEGLSGAEEHNDCEDLMDVNDCLIGNMQDVLDGYEVCDWKDFMGTFIGNLYETLKAMIYSTCGQWCAINYMYSGQTFHLGEETSGDAYIVAGKGVSFLLPHAGQVHLGDVSIDYLGGGMARGSGTYMFHKYDFTDAEGNVLEDGTKLTLTISAKLDYDVHESNNLYDTWEIPVTIDMSAPEIMDAYIEKVVDEETGVTKPLDGQPLSLMILTRPCLLKNPTIALASAL